MASDPTGKLVLVVEDDAMVVAVLGATLSQEGYEVVHANGRSEALTALDARSPSVMVVDIGLRDGNGLNLVREVRARGYTGALIVLSGFTQEASVLEGFAAGADDYMTKPFSPRELAARLRRWTAA